MIFIERTNTDPYFNIAAEEYVLKGIQEDVVMLWSSLPSVVVGKHQNAFKEINFPYVRKHKIPVIRRISGGGTVFHDSGNVNFTLITSEERKERFIDFHKFTDPIISFLRQFGVEATFEGKNNLSIQGKKISGNAAHVFKNRVMHHGTLLFNAELDKLNEAILPGELKIEDKAVQSVRASVGNILSFINEDISVSEFKAKLQKYLLKYYNISDIYYFSNKDNSLISALADEKYRKWEWNFGYSPAFQFSNVIDGASAKVSIKNGCIAHLDIQCSPASQFDFDFNKLTGSQYRKEAIFAALKEPGMENNLINKTLELLGF